MGALLNKRKTACSSIATLGGYHLPRIGHGVSCLDLAVSEMMHSRVATTGLVKR